METVILNKAKTVVVNKSESASLLQNLWYSILRDIRTRGFSRIPSLKIEALYREIDCPSDEAFIKSEAQKFGFSAIRSNDYRSYIFRKFHDLPSDRKVLEEIYRGQLEKDFESDSICDLCKFSLQEHPRLDGFNIYRGTRFKRIAARAGCTGGVVFEKVYEG